MQSQKKGGTEVSAFQFKQKKRDLRRPWKLHSWAAYWVLSHLCFSCRKCYSLIVRATPSCILCITALYTTKFGNCFFLCFVVIVGFLSIVVIWSLDIFLLQTENMAFLPLNQVGTGRCFLGLVLCHPSAVCSNWGSTVASGFAVSCDTRKTCPCSNT